MGTSPQGWVVLAQTSVEALWPVRAAAGGREHVGDAGKGSRSGVLVGV
mgnify:CR=1 FL=1